MGRLDRAGLTLVGDRYFPACRRRHAGHQVGRARFARLHGGGGAATSTRVIVC